MRIESSKKEAHTNKCMTFSLRDSSDEDYVFDCLFKFLSLLLNEFLQSEIMQKSRSVQIITNIIAVADEQSVAVCMFVVLRST